MSLQAIGIVSEDLQKAVRFYKLLGVELKEAGGADHYDATLPNGMKLMVDTVGLIQSFEPGFKKVRGTGLTLCFNPGSAAKVNALYQTIVDAGFASVKEPWDAFWGQRYACVQDPDGNQIDLFCAL